MNEQVSDAGSNEPLVFQTFRFCLVNRLFNLPRSEPFTSNVTTYSNISQFSIVFSESPTPKCRL